jgi:hypothetical protein
MNERAVDVGLETVMAWAKALEKDDQTTLIKELVDAGADADLGTVMALAKSLSSDGQAALIKRLIGSEGFTFVSGAHMVTVDLAVYIQSAEREVVSAVGEAICERIRSGK